MTPPRHWSHSLARAGEKTMRRLRKHWRDERWAEFGEGTARPRFAAKTRAKLGSRDKRRAFGAGGDG